MISVNQRTTHKLIYKFGIFLLFQKAHRVCLFKEKFVRDNLGIEELEREEISLFGERYSYVKKSKWSIKIYVSPWMRINKLPPTTLIVLFFIYQHARNTLFSVIIIIIILLFDKINMSLTLLLHYKKPYVQY